jgi:pimeloyl-ACP methyl ester carboxylesterase
MQHIKGTAQVGDIELAYERWGKATDPAVLLIMGLGAQLLIWPDSFCQTLVDKGYQVIRFDNRDIGLSSKIKKRSQKQNFWLAIARFQMGLANPAPYNLYDMAGDTVGLMSVLGIAKAHIIGASMGGMIGQIVAAKYPERVLSLGVLFSSNNQPFLPPPDPRAFLPLVKGPGANAPREILLQHSVKLFTAIGSPAYRSTPEQIKTFAGQLMDRSFHPAGVKRHFLAVMGTGNIKHLARHIHVPTVVVHGKEDRLLRPACSKAIAKSIKGAHLELIEGMGHDIPQALVPRLTGIFAHNMHRAV